MKQYNDIKAKYPDALLLFRVGDFYETFGSDAIFASKILDIVLIDIYLSAFQKPYLLQKMLLSMKVMRRTRITMKMCKIKNPQPPN